MQFDEAADSASGRSPLLTRWLCCGQRIHGVIVYSLSQVCLQFANSRGPCRIALQCFSFKLYFNMQANDEYVHNWVALHYSQRV